MRSQKITPTSRKQQMYDFLEYGINAQTNIRRDKNLLLFKDNNLNFAIYMIDETAEYHTLLNSTNNPRWKGFINPEEENYINKLLVSFVTRQNNTYSIPSIIFLNPIESYDNLMFDKDSYLGEKIYYNSLEVQDMFVKSQNFPLETLLSVSPQPLNKEYLAENYPRKLHVQNYNLGLVK